MNTVLELQMNMEILETDMPSTVPYKTKGFPYFSALDQMIPQELIYAKGKYTTRQPKARTQAVAGPSPSESSSAAMGSPSGYWPIPPQPSTPTATSGMEPVHRHALPPPSTPTGSTTNKITMGPLPALVTGPGVNLLSPSSSSTVPSYYAATSDSGSGLTSISQSKHKSSALSEGDQSCSKRNWPRSVTATAQQEGSAALTSIAGSLPQII
ncbi:uncharacterized protein F5891DRAFT_986892 [Suillus fuscotomentosus]|uniref:Uncharacterized protein n=1 Tax=Suillus fuscotomentosus TaxID=1912939 RepID=A0AAD4HD99_9AGAM|nr:uncharacterized protein F5891DRAFT_986892 [Suillus fuscotomentosus]KAG1890642.1 hypothetical protein F5891DRAFT_986892 [Suillus fuscotomentosus]